MFQDILILYFRYFYYCIMLCKLADYDRFFGQSILTIYQAFLSSTKLDKTVILLGPGRLRYNGLLADICAEEPNQTISM